MSQDAFIDYLVDFLKPTQRQALLQTYTDAVHDNGFCPVCGTDDMPIDKRGEEIKGDDVSKTAEWVEQHDDDCLVRLLEQTVNRCKEVQPH